MCCAVPELQETESMKKIHAVMLTFFAVAQVEAVKIDRVFDREVAVREVNYDKSSREGQSLVIRSM